METENNETKRKLYMNNLNKLLCTDKKIFSTNLLTPFFAVSGRKNFLCYIFRYWNNCNFARCSSSVANIKPGELMFSPKSHKSI